MDRRSFLKFIPGMIAAAAAMPEELLWTPAKTYFIPNTIKVATWDEISAVTLQRLVPRLIDDVFKESPLFAMLKSNRKVIFVGGDGPQGILSNMGGSLAEEEVLDKTSLDVVQDSMGITPGIDERQTGNVSYQKARPGYYRQRGSEVDRQQAMYRSSHLAVHSRATERPKGLVFPVSRFRSSHS